MGGQVAQGAQRTLDLEPEALGVGLASASTGCVTLASPQPL